MSCPLYACFVFGLCAFEGGGDADLDDGTAVFVADVAVAVGYVVAVALL